MARHIEHLPLALPWIFEQANRRERQSDHVISTPKALQSQTEVDDEVENQTYERDGKQASQQGLNSQDPQVASTVLSAAAHSGAHQWVTEKQSQEQSYDHSEGDHDSRHQTDSPRRSALNSLPRRCWVWIPLREWCHRLHFWI